MKALFLLQSNWATKWVELKMLPLKPTVSREEADVYEKRTVLRKKRVLKSSGFLVRVL